MSRQNEENNLSSYITDNFGKPTHYYEYLPFGELMVEQNQSTYYNNGYKFNAKELDAATGMYYYGARYYDPSTSIFLSVDPLAEQTMEPYSYVGNNPINFTDPTGMSKENYDPPTEGNFANGTVHTDDTGSWTYNDGIWGDNSGGGNNFGGELFIDARGNNSESYSGNRIDCVNCHHTTTVGNGTANNSAYERYTIWGNNRTGGDDEKSMRGQNVNAISYSISDVSLMGVGGVNLKGFNTVYQSGKMLQHWTSATSGAVALGEDKYIKKFVKYVVLYNGLNPDSVQVPMTNDQLNRFKDTGSASGSKFRDSLRNKYMDFNAAKIYEDAKK